MTAYSTSSTSIKGGWDKLVLWAQMLDSKQDNQRHNKETLDTTDSTHKLDWKDRSFYPTTMLGLCDTN